MLSPHRNNNSVFSRTCAGKRHPESRERGDRKGGNGGKREGERSERESVVPRQDKDSRRDGGHAPPQRHLERSEATTKTRFTGRKRVKRSDYPLSSRLNLSSRHIQKNSSFPGHAPGKDTLRAANAATKEGFTGRKRVKRKRLPVVFPSFSERGLTGENARANAVSGRALSPVKIKIPVASADMRRHSDTLRGAQRR